MKTYLRPRTARGTIGDALEIYRRNFVPILSVFLVTLPFALARDYTLSEKMMGSATLETLIHAAGVSLYQFVSLFVVLMVITVMVSMICLGNKPSLRLSVQWINKHLVGNMLSTYLVVLASLWAGAYLLQVVWDASMHVVLRWVLLLIIAGSVLFLYAVTMFIPCVVTLERVGGLAAFRRSKDLGKNFYVRNFALVFTTNIVAWFVYGFLLVAQVVTPVSNAIPNVIRKTGTLENIVVMLIAPISTICTVLLYYDMRVRKESYDYEVMTEELFD